ncbi:MAG: TonB-dependent receptor [Bacteroidota bacterium]
MKNNTILFKCTAVILLLLSSIMVYGQKTGSIQGTVQSELGEKLSNVNVVLKNTDRGTFTDNEGNFKIDNLAAANYTLEISYVGFEPIVKKITIAENQSTQFNFALKSSSTLLNEVYVKGDWLNAENSATTVNVIDIEEIQTLNIEQPLRLIEQVAGVDIVAYRQGGVADQFSIRGFGGGGHAGEAGVEIDGISLNEAEGHSDGYADLNVLIPLNLQRVRVYKGPSSVLFGRFAQGGTLAMETRKGGLYQDVSIRGGSFNTIDAQFAQGSMIPLGASGKGIQTNLAMQFFQTEGYSENSNILKGNVAGRFAYNITDKTEIALSLRGHESDWEAPGYISEAQFNDEDRRNKQDEFAENDGGEKSFYSERLDLTHTFNDNIKLLLFAYGLQQDFRRFAKFNFSPGGQSERFNTRNVFATGGSLNGASEIAGFGMDWTAGFEYYSEGTDRQRWNTIERVRQNQIQDREFTIRSISTFVQGEIALSKYFRPSIGLRYDTYTGDFIANDPGQDKINNSIENLSNVAPKLGFRSNLLPALDLRASASNGFALPNGTLKYDADVNVDPIQLWQYEVGLNYAGIDGLELDVVGFILNTSREIVEFPIGSGTLVNAGKTQRQGIESSATYTPVEGLRMTGTFSYIQTEILENSEDNLVGNSLTNIPETIATLDVNYVSPVGLGARFRLRDVGTYFTSQDNEATYEGYTVSNLNLFYNFNKQVSNTSRVFVEVLNLFNAKYAEAVFGGGGGRLFAAAPTRNFMIGINYNFK